MPSRLRSVEDFVKAHGGTRVVRKILVANNGMAATKAILSMRQWAFMELGSHSELHFVVMASSDDLEANAEFIRLADAFVEVPPGKNVNNYANVDLICKVAEERRVDAVWPGWGHASENPALPRALKKLGIVFLGPNESVMHALGDKIASTILAQSAKVPCIPWNGDGVLATVQADGGIPEEPFQKCCLQSYEEALACARRIGYPVVLKASEGGGGKGIRKCASDEDLKLAWEQVRTEVVGSPIFMMQLCVGARHLEVQLVGDEYGDVVALCGRDCSTQRRFQKIFEEGPATIAPRESFREAEKAAQRLAMSVKYCGAGTVEYLYKPASDEFFFLELNPRLQVEHPVTEGITGVNMPALQLQVGMGIPLSRVPDIRRFYGLVDDGTSKIDFLEDKYVCENCHVIAARITAENPDDGFRPCPGKVDRVRFQSSPAAWGYFSIGANGQIHEFADSQFGHIFARGPTREHARKALQLALKNVQVVGEIRTPIEYLVELADTKAFRENTIDTAWLDKLIADKSVRAHVHTHDAIFYAACFRAYNQVKESKTKLLELLKRGHLPLHHDLSLLQEFSVEIAYESIKYVFQVARIDEDALALTIDTTTLEASVREQPDGSIYIKTGSTIAQVSGIEEVLGLRLRIEGSATITFPRIRDPSELRSDFNGKLVRYLHADGSDIAEGEPFAEIEAMKMIMSLRSASSGKIRHALNPGAVVGAGEVLATLQLKDPSSVHCVKPFEGDFVISGDEVTPDAVQRQAAFSRDHSLSHHSVILDLDVEEVYEALAACLRGFILPKNLKAGHLKVIQRLFQTDGEVGFDIARQQALDACIRLLRIFVETESFFAGLVGGDETQIKAKFDGDVKELLPRLIAHHGLAISLQIVCGILRGLHAELAELDRERGNLPAQLRLVLDDLVKFKPSGGYGEVSLLSATLMDKIRTKPFFERMEDVRATIKTTSRQDLDRLAGEMTFQGNSYFGLDLISTLFKDDDLGVVSKAVEFYMCRQYRGFNISNFETNESKDVVENTPAAKYHATWTHSPVGVNGTKISGYAIVVPTFKAFKSLKTSWLIPQARGQLAEMHILVADVELPELKDSKMHEHALAKVIEETAELIAVVGPILQAKGYARVYVLLVRQGYTPMCLHYVKAQNWTEKVEYRNLRPSFPLLVELPTMMKDFSFKLMHSTRRSCVMLRCARDTKAETLMARAVNYSRIGLENFTDLIMQSFLEAFDALERVFLDPAIDSKKMASHIFVHFVWGVAGCTDRDLKFMTALFRKVIQQLTALGPTMLRVRLEAVEVKIWVGDVPLRLQAASSHAWTEVGLKEKLDQETGHPVSWTDVESGEITTIASAVGPIEQKLIDKRKIARKEGTTYIYDFLSLFSISLTQLWFQANSQTGLKVPDTIFSAQELVLDERDELRPVSRPSGVNDVGMVAWLVSMKTLEYPGGRELILLGNDLTIKAGSFGIVEDKIFHQASLYARRKGIPRVYIACNSGARLGCVEELKKFVQVAWTDPADPSKGFDYLYLTDEDLAKLPLEVVKAHKIKVGEQTRNALDAIIGIGLPSVKHGIGVENLQGSGLIAGETSRAYEETFTLSYVTGRSVGIGAYLNRLGQRNIQMVKGPMILTGFQALNKLLGQQVYTTQDQLGGPHIMVPNGVTHKLVQNDQDGVEAILQWMSYIPDCVRSLPPYLSPIDPVDRPVSFLPSKTPYDPRHMLSGTIVDGVFQSGFCDEGSFHEYMEGWGRTVVVGRGRLGGLPVGIVAVETRSIVRFIPADPADPTSHDIREAQAGQVWFPDSAYKTAQAIRDFNRGENLPLIIFANWRGFSGGTRDMFAEVLKYGAMIVDSLVDYKHPVTIYIPPNGELRGGAWVVVDPQINPDQMEMFADVESRGGILEPPAAAEIVFKRDEHVIQLMHRCDEDLQRLDADAKAGKDVAKDIKAREKLLLPVYRQVSVTYCDLHDRSDRMKSLGCIHEQLQWSTSRSYLHWRIRRRVIENGLVQRLRAVAPNLTFADAKATVESWIPTGFNAISLEDDRAVTEWLISHVAETAAQIEKARQEDVSRKVFDLVSSLPTDRMGEVVRDLIGYSKVVSTTGTRQQASAPGFLPRLSSGNSGGYPSRQSSGFFPATP